MDIFMLAEALMTSPLSLGLTGPLLHEHRLHEGDLGVEDELGVDLGVRFFNGVG